MEAENVLGKGTEVARGKWGGGAKRGIPANLPRPARLREVRS